MKRAGELEAHDATDDAAKKPKVDPIEEEEQPAEPAHEENDSSDDDAPLVTVRGPAVKKGSECPYLDTISRQARAAVCHHCSVPGADCCRTCRTLNSTLRNAARYP
jgi:hypothetical protein